MSKKSPNLPPPPDPRVTAQAQADANIASATAQQKLNMIGTTGPQGTVNYEADATQPGGYRQVTALSPAEQAIYDAQKSTELGATNIAHDQLGRVRTALETPLNTEGLSALQGTYGHAPLSMNVADAGKIQTGFAGGGNIQDSFNKGRALQYGFDPGQQVQGQVGGDLNMQRLLGSEAVYQQAASRLDPRFDKEQAQLDQRLASQGFSANSQGAKDARDDFGRNKTDAYNQAIFSSVGAGEDAANALFGRQVAQGQFANQAAGQQYAQNQGVAGFNNQTAGQDYTQNLGAAQFGNEAQNQRFGQNQQVAQFGNQAQQQQFGQNLARQQAENAAASQWTQQNQQAAQFGNEARQQGLQERSFIQNTPINQLTGLLSLGQVGQPQGIQYSPTSVGQTDVLGSYALNQQAQNANAQLRQQASSGLMNGLFSLGGAAIMASDRELKTDARLLRVRRDGLGVWAFRYLDDPEGVVRIGFMADEVKKVRPDLVVRRADGFLAVSYAGLDLEAA